MDLRWACRDRSQDRLESEMRNGATMQGRRIHLIGICGTARASWAGMLKDRGFDGRGPEGGAYPPMSDYLADLGIEVKQPFDVKNLEPAPDLVVIGNAIS